MITSAHGAGVGWGGGNPFALSEDPHEAGKVPLCHMRSRSQIPGIRMWPSQGPLFPPLQLGCRIAVPSWCFNDWEEELGVFCFGLCRVLPNCVSLRSRLHQPSPSNQRNSLWCLLESQVPSLNISAGEAQGRRSALGPRVPALSPHPAGCDSL